MRMRRHGSDPRMTERLTTHGELRAEGRRLSGTVMRYGDVSPSHRERFEPGSLRMAEAVHLDLFHDVERAVAWHPGGGLTLNQDDAALTMRAELPPIPAAERALDAVRTGKANGLSVEFAAVKEKREGQIRVIQDAVLSGIGLVKRPSYQQSKVEARQAGTVRGSIPFDQSLQCRCHTGNCDVVKFSEDAFNDALEDERLIAVLKDYAAPLASVKRETLRLTKTRNALGIELDLPDTAAARDLVTTAASVPLIFRPLFTQDESDFEELDGEAFYRRVAVRAILLGATDASEGWPEAEFLESRALSCHSLKVRRGCWL